MKLPDDTATEEYLRMFEYAKRDVAEGIALKLQHSESQNAYDNHIAKFLNHEYCDAEYQALLLEYAPTFDKGIAFLSATGAEVGMVPNMPSSMQETRMLPSHMHACVHRT